MVLASATDNLPLTWGLMVLVGSVVGGTAWLTWFIRDQFEKVMRKLYRIVSRHNREDDDRFAAMSDDIWATREDIAEQSGKRLPPRKTFPRRNYLVEDQDDG